MPHEATVQIQLQVKNLLNPLKQQETRKNIDEARSKQFEAIKGQDKELPLADGLVFLAVVPSKSTFQKCGVATNGVRISADGKEWFDVPDKGVVFYSQAFHTLTLKTLYVRVDDGMFDLCPKPNDPIVIAVTWGTAEEPVASICEPCEETPYKSEPHQGKYRNGAAVK